ncbi:polysaccharide biosynthesis protein [Luteimonas sp. A478]
MDERATISRAGIGQPHVDAFRTLRTRLLAATNGAPSATIVVAPVSRGSGGSYVARNLAAAFAFDETINAVLIDCDLFHGTQHDTLRLDPVNGGLVNYLEDPAVLVGSMLYETGVPRLHLLPAGTATGASAEYLSSFRMRLLIDVLRSRTPPRHVILDSPAVKDSPDARILADYADLVVLVAGYGRDSPEQISRAAAEFNPGKFAGVVFNEGP